VFVENFGQRETTGNADAEPEQKRQTMGTNDVGAQTHQKLQQQHLVVGMQISTHKLSCQQHAAQST
jgi:hypothetical protein